MRGVAQRTAIVKDNSVTFYLGKIKMHVNQFDNNVQISTVRRKTNNLVMDKAYFPYFHRVVIGHVLFMRLEMGSINQTRSASVKKCHSQSYLIIRRANEVGHYLK